MKKDKSVLFIHITFMAVVSMNVKTSREIINKSVQAPIVTVYETVEPVQTIEPSPTVAPTPTVVATVQPTQTVEPTPTPTPIDPDELDLLAHLIYAEAGSDWCEDEMLYGVGSVVLNRMASKYYPDTMHEVIYQKGQYACIIDGNIKKEPNERAYRIAEDLLKNGSRMPEKVIYQAEFKQGKGVYKKVQNMYFCYE